MCVGCYTLSVLTFLSPVNEAPQPANVPALSQPAEIPAQIQKNLTPTDVRTSIAAMLQSLPSTPNAKLLRDAFSQMQAQLVGVNSREQAYKIVSQSMQQLSDKVLAAPNPVELLQFLQEAERAASQPQASSLLDSKWGWLS